MIVYIEYVVIDNFIVDYLLIRSAAGLVSLDVKPLRVVFCAALGVGFALVFPLINFSGVFLAALKISVGALLILFCAKFRSVKEYLKTLAVFFLVTFAVGGIVTGVYGLFGDEIGELPVATVFIPVFISLKLLTRAVKKIVRLKRKEKLVFNVELKSGAKTVETLGLFDTGNGLKEDGQPVIVVDKSVFKKLFTADLNGLALKKVAVTTVAGKSENLGFTIEEVAIYFGEKPNIYKDVRAIVSKTPLDYGAILNPELKEKKC